jgi:hypothetical protein
LVEGIVRGIETVYTGRDLASYLFSSRFSPLFFQVIYLFIHRTLCTQRGTFQWECMIFLALSFLLLVFFVVYVLISFTALKMII